MSSETLASIIFVIISFSWIMYLLQEVFISGASAINMSISKNEGERKQIQVATGLHFDGMQVWLIVALIITFGAFPLVFGTILTYLYVVFFLLLYAIMGRGISIEVIYKLESPKWVKSMAITWVVSSILIIFILGVYFSNIFLGFPLGSDGMTDGFLSVFNVTSISGGLFFLALAFVSGAAWINMTTEGELGQRAIRFVKKVGVIYTVPIFFLLVVMGFNNTASSIFIGELFSASPMFFMLPALTAIFAILTSYFGYRGRGIYMFIFSLLTLYMFMVTGFVGTYPYMVPSKIMVENGITIFDAMVSFDSLQLIFIIVLIFYPIIIGYQTWKYIRFTKKIKFNDE